MPSNPQRLTFLQHILRDGITPFYYRHGVRALLGMPERDQAKAGRIHSSHSIPVGFRYRQQDSPGIFPTPQEPAGGNPPCWLGTREMNSPQQDRSSIHQKKSSPSSDALLSSGKPAHVTKSPSQRFRSQSTEQGEGASAVESQSGKPVWPAVSHQEQARPLPPSTRIQPAAPSQTTPSAHQRDSSDRESRTVQRLKIDIPGNSQEPKNFPLLSGVTTSQHNLTQEDQLNPPREGMVQTPQTKTGNSPAHTPELTLPTFHSLKETDTIQPNAQETPPPIMASKSTVSPHISLRANDAAEEQPEPPRPVSTIREPVALRPVSRNVSQPADGLTNRSNRETSRRIDQLRQAVQELTAKRITTQSAEQEAPTKYDRPQFPVVSPPTVVRIQQLPRRFKAPDAFWERSHLGRMHLRLLR